MSQKHGELGQRIGALVQAGQIAEAYALLAPVLAQRTPFPKLGLIGEAVGAGPLRGVNAFLERRPPDFRQFRPQRAPAERKRG